MTSAHSMKTSAASAGASILRRYGGWIPPVVAAFSLALLLLAAGCAAEPALEQPVTLVSPYERPQLWAVAPFANESGVSIVRGDRVADLFAQQAEEIRGIDVIPVNRVLLAMRRLEMPSIATPSDATHLMNVLGVDGLIVGTVTTYNPYQPPALGAAVQLYRAAQRSRSDLDPVALTRAARDDVRPGAMRDRGNGGDRGRPAAQASGVFDASNHQVLRWLDEYSVGRVEPDGAYGPRIYLVNMELYTQFVAFRLMHDLLAHERPAQQPALTQATAP